MRVLSKNNVFDAALERIEYLFDEFENVIVGFSGGKDSTCTLNLSLMVAEKKNRLPLKVMFLDQEAEWRNVIEYVREVMSDPRVEPLWLQVPIKLFNSTSTDDCWLKCWEPGVEWIRPQEEISIKENKYGTDRFAEMFTRFVAVEYPDKKTCYLSGVRCEESPTRAMALTHAQTYKHITYGKVLSKKLEHYTFYPLYDWSYTDIWKAIHDNNWSYCRIYDYMYQHGYKVLDMRVSNVHHETATKHLYHLQEIEGDTWARIVQRIKGINTAGHLKDDMLKVPATYPYMFESWVEYRDYLLENLIIDTEHREIFKKKFESMDVKYEGMKFIEDMYKAQITAILKGDYHMTIIGNWERMPSVDTFRKYKKGKITRHMAKNKYI